MLLQLQEQLLLCMSHAQQPDLISTVLWAIGEFGNEPTSDVRSRGAARRIL